MKKLALLLFTLSILFTSSLFGSTGGGLKLGANFATAVGDDADDAEYKAGFVGGVFLNVEINQILSIQPEVLFSMKGARYEESITILGTTYTAETEAKLNYLEIPVIAKFSYRTGNLKPFLGLGLYGAFEIDSKVTVKASSGNNSGNIADTSDDLDDVRDFDVGMIVNAGLGYSAGYNGMFTFELRYSMGFLPVRDDPDNGDPADLRNSVISLMIGYEI